MIYEYMTRDYVVLIILIVRYYLYDIIDYMILFMRC